MATRRLGTVVWRLATGFALAGLAACMAPVPQPYPAAEGGNRIDGRAVVALQGGPTVTCAGAHVGLYAAAGPVLDRIHAVYGPGDAGYVRVADYPRAAEPPDFVQALRRTRCDDQGRFVFDGLADGDYVITTNVVWRHKYVTYGGGLMRIVRLRGGGRQITISNQAYTRN